MSDTPISTASVNLAITTTRPAGKVNDKVARIIAHNGGSEYSACERGILVGIKAMDGSFREIQKYHRRFKVYYLDRCVGRHGRAGRQREPKSHRHNTFMGV